jgi:uncharacterized protein (TIGR00106 family)
MVARLLRGQQMPISGADQANPARMERNTMLLAEFSIWPMDKGESVGAYVARCVDIVDRSGLPYKLGPLGTCIEGEYGEVMAVIALCQRSLEQDCHRFACTIKMVWRAGAAGRLEEKVKSVVDRIGREIRT